MILPLIVFGFFLFLTTGCEDEPALYTLTVSVSPPDGGDAEGQGDYEEGEEVLLAAVANEGYEFISWTDAEGDVLSTESDFVYMMPSEDVELTANFRHEDGTYGTVTDIDGNEYQTVYIGGR